MNLIHMAERGYIPDSIMRWGTRRICKELLQDESANPRKAGFIASLPSSPLALATDEANEQHYELPPKFFELTLGQHLKYSCGYYPEGISTLDDGEAKMLQLTCARAGLQDGMKILEMGCGWGSLTCWMAAHYPNAEITAVSNSHSQREHIEAKLKARGLDNVTIITCDMNEFGIDQYQEEFDRAVSIEMFEHMRNYPLLMERISGWLQPEGKLFVHIFCHQEWAYPYETDKDENWMAKTFFTGGMMPSFDIFEAFPEHLQLDDKWWVNGVHYEKTSNHWLALMDQHKPEIMALFTETYGNAKDAKLWWNRWRMFYLGVAEFFGYADGKEWGVGHFLLKKA